ncbi:hypothetical protein NM688_g1201 [Phlebia brevispora]|uniref:Uncharacterized protein n=1 Tax=Phlebia brevispora TaxID=194682 RepID=A0ACC1TCA1_9APHY|nr:hypothetical protein NM688_g1201 [Phlebia brevispora]
MLTEEQAYIVLCSLTTMVSKKSSPKSSVRHKQAFSTSKSSRDSKSASGTKQSAAPVKQSELRKKWKAYLAENTWECDDTFEHPVCATHTQTLNQSEVLQRKMGTVKLQRKELGPLRYQLVYNPNSKLYNQKWFAAVDVDKLILKKAEIMRIERAGGTTRETRNSRKGMPESGPYKKSTTIILPLTPLRTIRLWTKYPGGGNMYVAMSNSTTPACCISEKVTPDQLRDLISPDTKWLDLRSVAVRALEVHGGLITHNKLVTQHLARAVERLPEEGESFTPGLRAYEKWMEKLASYDLGASSLDENSLTSRRVKQYAPPYIVPNDDPACTATICYGFGTYYGEA